MSPLRRLTAVLLLAFAAASEGQPPPPPSPGPAVVRIVAKKFSYTPSEVRLRKGVTVILELVSEDRVHGFNLPALGIRTDVTPGKAARVSITPKETGSFPFHCDVFCGEGHDEMNGAIVVTE